MELAPEMPRRRVRRNLDCLAAHRPLVLRTLEPVLSNANIRLTRSTFGSLTIDSEKPNPDPIGEAHYQLRQLKGAVALSQPIGLCGVGDGYLLSALGSWQSPVLLIEPDPLALLAAMHLHDFSIQIAERRFTWLVGHYWLEQVRPDLQIPTHFVRSYPDAGAIIEQMLHQHLANLRKEPACV